MLLYGLFIQGGLMSYPKGSVNRLLEDAYKRIPYEERPSYFKDSTEWKAWLESFRAKYPSEVSRMTEDLEARALYVLKYSMPNHD